MGKKGRKTRWRRLPIGGPESTLGGTSNSTALPPDEDQDVTVSSSPEHRITFNEDEYTKITTPRQDVLFKKGYLGRRRTNNPSSDPQEIHSADSVESGEYIGEEPAQYASYMPSAGATGFMDPAAGVFYVNSNAYELYDPYSGNVTVVVGPAPQYPPQPVLAAMPCQPVPLTPLEWFNPPAPWVCPQYNSRRKRYSTDSQNCSAQSSESTGPPGSPQEPIEEGAGAMFPPQPPPYIYPGYMFGAPVYSINGVNVQGVVPQPQVPPQMTVDMMNNPNSVVGVTALNNSATTTTKRRKKRRRRRRGGVTDEGSESSCEEVIVGCDAGVCNQSGASSDAGQGSSCSKTNSDSGINTEPTPDSGSNTPPLMPQLCTNVQTQTFQRCTSEEDQDEQQQHSSEIEIQPESEPVSSSISTPEALKRTYESLPSEEGETLQELSCGSEFNTEHKTSLSSSEHTSCREEERLADGEKMVPDLNEQNDSTRLDDIVNEETETDSNLDRRANDEVTDLKSNESLCDSSEQIQKEMISCDIPLSDSSLPQEIKIAQVDEVLDEKSIQSFRSLSSESESVNAEEQQQNRNERIKIKNVCDIELSTNEEKELKPCEEILCEKVRETDKENLILTDKSIDESLVVKERDADTLLQKTVDSTDPKFHENGYFFAPQVERAPVPPPRRRRSLYRAAERVAKKTVEDAIESGINEAVCSKCQRVLPITEAVTRWLQSQGSAVLSPADSDSDDDERVADENVERKTGLSTNQKNVEGNPFLAPYLNGSRQRVAETDDSGSSVSSAGEWDMYDHDTHTRVICDPATSVDKYYRLSADDIDDKVASTSHSMIKTAVHIRRAGPFPCGVCCIIQ